MNALVVQQGAKLVIKAQFETKAQLEKYAERRGLKLGDDFYIMEQLTDA